MSFDYPETQEDRDRLREHNLRVFDTFESSVAKSLRAHVPASKLVFDEDGQPDLEFQGKKFYDGKYHEFVDRQFESFLNNPFRFSLSIPQPSQLDNYGADFLTNVLKRATVEENVEFAKNYIDMKTFFSVVFGVGLCGHIKKIVEVSECTAMFIVDPNLESLHHSLEIFDWEPIFEGRRQKRGKIIFLIGDDAIFQFDSIRNYVRLVNTPAVDGMLLYKHYNNPLFDELSKNIRESGDLFLAGLGFYSDETNMLKHSYQLLSDGTAHIYTQRKDRMEQTPCFIVGCGPSLDGDLKYIREMADRAVVISSGSALGPLLTAGVTPDFQIEVENIGILPIMQHVAETFDISDICLVTSTTVEPEIVDYFKRIIYHFRPALSPFHILSNDPRNTIPFHDPSVVNSALGFAQDLGFREFYFFGCDMGTRDADMHHAKNSYHFKPDAQLPDNDFCIRVPANFGGNTFTSRGLAWVKAHIESAIRSAGHGRRYFNSSDGALLLGTTAKFAKSIKLPELSSDDFKSDFVRDAYEAAPVMDLETFKSLWRQDDLRTITDQVFEELHDIVQNATFLEDRDYLREINRIVNDGQTPIERGVGTWIRGTLQMILLAVEFYCNRMNTPDSSIGLEEIIREELHNTLDILHEESQKFIDARP